MSIHHGLTALLAGSFSGFDVLAHSFYVVVDAEEVVQKYEFNGFPIVLDSKDNHLLGYVPCNELRFALGKFVAFSFLRSCSDNILQSFNHG